MKKILLAFIVSVSTLLFIASGQSIAASIYSTCGQGSANGTPDVCQSVDSQSPNSDPIISLIKSAIDIISYVIGIASIIIILICSIRMITSGGSAEASASARSGIIYALVGVAIAVLAQAIVTFALSNV